MRLARHKDDSLEARFTRADWVCLTRVLGLYPRVPPASQKLSRKASNHPNSAAAAAQTLLDEALAEHRAENKKALVRMLSDPGRLKLLEKVVVLKLSLQDAFSLLQMLNDIRVGSWIALGSPEVCKLPAGEEQQMDFYVMELAGHYEAALIAALETGG